MSANVGRNDPCPCGSGLKYKQCCAGKTRLNVKGRRGWVLGAIGLVVAAVVAWSLMRPPTRPIATSGARTSPPSTSAGVSPGLGTSSMPNPASSPAPQGVGTPTNLPGPAAATPQAWAFDASTNKHFDPNHGHWHDGPPPPPESRGVSAPQPSATTTPPGPAPAPWTYDAQKNQHWDPGHGHWHPGPPPAGSP